MEIGDVWSFVYMEILQTSSTDPHTIAACLQFNLFFSLIFEMGIIAFMFTIVVALISRS